MTLRDVTSEPDRIERRRLLRLLASASLPLILAACAAKRSEPDPRMGQTPGSPGGRS